MPPKNHSFELVRAVAIMVIVLGHFLVFSSISTSLGSHWGGVGNCVFFVLSALLFGLKWEKSNKEPFHNSFFKKRFVRISSSLYPFLIVLIVLFLIFNIKFRVIDAIFNFLFLGWFAKLPGNGHLWFLTVLMICYILFFFMSKKWNNRLNQWWVWVLLGIIAIFCLFLVENKGLPGHAFITIYLAVFSFANASKIIEWTKKVSLTASIIQFTLLGSIAIYLFLSYDINTWNRAIAVLIGNICGLSLLLLLLRIPYVNENKLITFISGVSFELYLIHHGLCQGDLSVLHLVNNLFISLLLLLAISFASAFILNKFSSLTKNYFDSCNRIN